MENSKIARFSAGCSAAKLTPTRDVFLGGYADKDDEINLCVYPDHILGDVYVRTLVLEGEGQRALFVCVDACVINEGRNVYDGFRQDLALAANTQRDRVFIINTHNHQSHKYLQEPETEIILQSVRDAVADLEPCTGEYLICKGGPGVCRRPRYGVAPDLPYDNTVTLLKLLRESGEEKALIINYPLHNTGFGNGTIPNWKYMSPELMGFALMKLEQMGRTPFFFDGFYGASGPNFSGSPTADHDTIRKTGEDFALWLAAREGYQPVEGEGVSFLHWVRRIPVNPVYGPDAGENMEFFGCCFGKLAFLGVNCEPFSELGAEIRKTSAFEPTLFLGNANGFLGYIPVSSAFDDERELECKLNKTPFTKGIAEQFTDLCRQFLSALADVEENS